MCFRGFPGGFPGVFRERDLGGSRGVRLEGFMKTQMEELIAFKLRSKHVSLFESQKDLLRSRKKWGMLYCLATLTGFLCAPRHLGDVLNTGPGAILRQAAPLPAICFLLAVGAYILNDLVDSDLDRACGKGRPISSGRISKRQAWFFVLWTNGLALLLAVITCCPATILATLALIVLGLLYSLPPICLAASALKTLSVSSGIVLCALLGVSGIAGLEIEIHTVHVSQTLFMLGTTIFITSTVNDLGDVEGDRAAGRRTLPILLGQKQTALALIVLVGAMSAASWMFYLWSDAKLATATLMTLIGLFISGKLLHMMPRLADLAYVRAQHKRIFPLNLVVQALAVLSICVL